MVAALTVSLGAVSPERQRKADYYFMEAQSRQAADEGDAAYLLLRRAWELDSVSSTVPGGQLGAQTLALSRGDSAMFARGLELLARQFQAEPGDMYAGYNLALNYERAGMTDEALKVWARLDSLNADTPGVLWRRAAVESRYGSKTEALELIRRVERLEGLNPQLVMQETSLLLELGDTVAATECVESMLAAMPADAEARVYASAFFEDIGDSERSEAYVEEALRLDPSNGAAYYSRARRYQDAGRTEEYAAEIRRAVMLDDLDLENKMGLISDYLNEYAESEEHRPAIEEMLGAVLAQYPHDETLRRYVSGYYVGVGELGKAAEQLSYVADMNHDDPRVWDSLVRLYASVDSMPQSVAAAREAVRYLPDNGDLRLLLGMVLSQSGEFDAAVAEMRRALAVTTGAGGQSAVYTSMGDVWQQAEQPDSVVAAYEAALALDPDNDLALNNYAYYLAEQQRELARAEQMSSRSMVLRPGQATYLDTYAWVMYRLGNYQQAKQYMDTALLRSGDNLSAELLEHAGDICYKIDRTEQALDYWRQALELEPDNERLQTKVKTGKL